MRIGHLTLVATQLALLVACGGKTIVISDEGDAQTDSAPLEDTASTDVLTPDDAPSVDTSPVDVGIPCSTEGATETLPCGTRCGSLTRICSSGSWISSKCVDKGECDLGSTEPETCPSGSVAKRVCDTTCTWQSGCTGVPLDVILLIDTTGSLVNSTSGPNKFALMSALVTPMLTSKGFDVRVGVVEFKDFGDPTIVGGIVSPTHESTTIKSGIDSLASGGGGDEYEGAVLALSELAGGPSHAGSHPLMCDSGTLAGGCFRKTAKKAIVVVSDTLQHNAPDGMGGIVVPYTDGTLETWDSTAALLKAKGIDVFAITEPKSKQMWAAMETSLGAMAVDRVWSGDMNMISDWTPYFSGVLGLMKAAYPGL